MRRGSPPWAAMFACTQPSARATSSVRAVISTAGSNRWLIATNTNPRAVKARGFSCTKVLSPDCQPPPWIQNTTGRLRAPEGA